MLPLALVAATAARGAGYPAALYPPAVPAAAGHALTLCPSATGLQPFSSQAVKLARREAAAYGRRSLQVDLRDSDKAWWSQVRRLWKGRASLDGGDVVIGSEPAGSSGFAVFLTPACGARVVDRSLLVAIGPGRSGPGPHCDACNDQLFFVDRDGRPLIYFLY